MIWESVTLALKRVKDVAKVVVSHVPAVRSARGARSLHVYSVRMARLRAATRVLQWRLVLAHVSRGHAPVVVVNGQAVRVMFAPTSRLVKMGSTMTVMA